MEVPTTSVLSSIYPEDALADQKPRWNALLSKFKEHYGSAPGFVSRSPGRVNIIGEHIDYSLYEVIPMAIEADVLLAVRVRQDDRKIHLANVHDSKFPKRDFEIPDSGHVEIDSKTLEWTNYFKSGLKGAMELLRKKNSDFQTSVGMDILADGTVPSGGGLSSSAAFVCASALAVMKANGADDVNKKELTEVAIVAERSVGVNSGGMDQSASVFPLQGSALYVSFVPELSAKRICFPETKSPLTFVVAQSFVAADKHVTAPVCYNLRVVECTLAALVLHKIFGLKKPLPSDAGPLGVSLRGFQDTFFEETEGIENNHNTSVGQFQEQLQDLVHRVDGYLPQEEGYDRQQLSEILQMEISEIEEKYMSKFPVRAEKFKIRQRVLHVFSEAIRVLQFMDLLNSKPKDDNESEKLLEDLGGLLNDTQDSCRESYECSCPELDELCSLARSAGSYGSRLTGAGWGGCSVHLVPEDKVDKVKQKWEHEYYRKKFPDITEGKMKDAIVVSKPGSGSSVFLVEGRESLL